MTQNILQDFYDLYEGLPLPSTALTEDEIQFISVCIGFPRTQRDFVQAVGELIAMEIIVVRQTIQEILCLEDLKKESIPSKQLSRTDNTYVNQGYTDELIQMLATECKKLARMLRLPILDNLYVSHDDVEGYLDATHKVIMGRRTGNNYISGRSLR